MTASPVRPLHPVTEPDPRDQDQDGAGDKALRRPADKMARRPADKMARKPADK